MYNVLPVPESPCNKTLKGDSPTGLLSIQDWIPIFRAYSESGLDVYSAWTTNNINNINTDEGPSHLLLQPTIWPFIKEVKVSMVNDHKQMTYITFTASGSTRSNWFSRDRIIESTYVDLMDSLYNPESPASYSISGFVQIYRNVTRRFYAYWKHSGCHNDIGWIAVLDILDGFCFWERNGIRPSFMYCSGTSRCLYPAWYSKHEPRCAKNHEGNAGQLDPENILCIFRWSEEKHNLGYTCYLADVDPKRF
ncbi:hypothetical protein LSH36_61g05009 [Paralvinella palmiformis]|uniref:Uncharacterized protein n=1 Tax=Paralvinella palmiformis TaxID=53620 RepID=A0AAD9K4W7_9ANNE|nr:hypothetical protein LSH36_61g05009 [Paralvinella palmiformis]